MHEQLEIKIERVEHEKPVQSRQAKDIQHINQPKIGVFSNVIQCTKDEQISEKIKYVPRNISR
jgi:hypothetical protein